MATTMGAIIIERVRAMATTALAAVVVANMTRCADRNGTEGTSAGRLHSVAHAMADIFALALAVAAE
jgi:orotate phosphoribosyltransferase-like protein